MRPEDQDCLIEHASAVALAGQAIVIAGASGRGKSGLALQLMAFGADLVADDRCCLWVDGGTLFVDAPATIKNRIEARHLGILNAASVGPTAVAAYVDLNTDEDQRLPPHREHRVLGQQVRLFRNVDSPYFAAGLIQFLKAGRWA